MAKTRFPETMFPKEDSALVGLQKGPAKRRAALRYVVDEERVKKAQADNDRKMGSKQGYGKLEKSVLNMLDGPDDSIERLAFERDPQRISEFAGIWRPKLQLIPDTLLKRIAIQDDLVAAVVHTRSNHVAQHGRKQTDRHAMGFKFMPDEGVMDDLAPEEKKALQDRIDRAEKLLSTCGQTKGWKEQDRCSFTEYLYQSARNAVVVGRLATEVIYVPDPHDPANEDKRRFHSFRATDAGTIYFSAPYTQANQKVRDAALRMLETLKNEKLKPEKFEQEEYAWVQVIDGRPLQAFGPKEMLVHNFYPVTDVELQGYPLTPLDTAISAVTTHINITNHNKLYFQSGRATRGMLIIKSQDVDVEVVQAVKQQFNAAINAVQNSWRMPVFGIGPEDELTWEPIDNGTRDMEYQFLSDSNARTIMAAFGMSPEELPGYQHLSRGTNNQALSESNESYKLTAARDVGIRPLIAQFEDFINDNLIPLIDPYLAKICKVKLLGLDVDDAEKETVKLQQDMAVHMNMDEVQERVEKDPYGAAKGGQFPLNQAFQQVIEKYLTFGQILEYFFGIEGASQHPDKQFYQNPMWFNWVQLQQQQQQMEQQAQAQQQQAAMQQGGGQPPPDGGGGAPPPQGAEKAEGDLGSGIDQLISKLGKAEKDLPKSKQRARARLNEANRRIMASFEADTKNLVGELAALVDQHIPTKKKQPKA